jgi:hypothetical protein
MTIFTFIIATLAAYRLAVMIAREEGPFSIFSELRGRIDPNQATWIGRGLNCAACVSVWTSLIVVLAILYLPTEITTPIMFWLAAACGALLINRWSNQ